jgi:hypothetical protein
MAATARVVVLMTPEEKAALEAKAKQAGAASTAEFVRHAVDAFEIAKPGEAEELAAVLEQFHRVHAETLRQLDQTDRSLDAALAAFAADHGTA